MFSESGERATLHVALFAQKSAKLRLIDNANGNERLHDAMQREQCLAGVNGGYFDPNDRTGRFARSGWKSDFAVCKGAPAKRSAREQEW